MTAGRIILVVGVAYLITGFHYVMRHLAQPVWNQPQYVRSKRIVPIILGGLGWLLVTLSFPWMCGWHWKALRGGLFSLLLFGLLIAFGLKL